MCYFLQLQCNDSVVIKLSCCLFISLCFSAWPWRDGLDARRSSRHCPGMNGPDAKALHWKYSFTKWAISVMCSSRQKSCNKFRQTFYERFYIPNQTPAFFFGHLNFMFLLMNRVVHPRLVSILTGTGGFWIILAAAVFVHSIVPGVFAAR